MRTLVIAALLVVLFFAVRTLMRAAPAKSAALIKRFAWIAAILVFLFLLLTGRLPWLFALVAAAIPLLRRVLPYLRHVPFVYSLWSRFAKPLGQNSKSVNGQHSSVSSNYIQMTLDHASGAMNGTVLQGRFKDMHLQAMSLTQLLTLFHEIQNDHDSVALLQTYLDHAHRNWREQAQSAGANQYSKESGNSASLSHSEACQILGVEMDADRAEIIAAHKRLMQKIHPDRGGSPYLAAKINQAKDFLLRKNSN